MAKVKKAPKKVPKKETVLAKTVLDQTEPVPPPVPVPSKKELAQEALDMLGVATPSVGSDGTLFMWLRGPYYKGIEARLVAIVNS